MCNTINRICLRSNCVIDLSYCHSRLADIIALHFMLFYFISFYSMFLSYQLYRCAFVTVLIKTRVSSGGSMLEPGGTGPQILPSPQVLLLIGSIVISLSRCCLPNDEGSVPPPNIQIFFPRTATASQSATGLENVIF